MLSLRIFFVKFRYIINCLLLPPAKVICIIYTTIYLILLFDGNSDFIGIDDYFIGVAMMCVVADLIYASKKQRFLSYKLKISIKKQQSLKKIVDDKNKFYEFKLSENKNRSKNFDKDLISSVQYIPQDADPYFFEAAEIVVDKEKASIGMIQRNFKIGFNRAERIMNQLEQAGIVGEEIGTYPRDVLISRSELEKMLQDSNITERYNICISNSHEEYIRLAKDYDNMSGLEFEHYCADILQKNGFSNVEVTQGSGDHGIDILAEKDDITYAIQCKCYSSNIGNSAVQQAHTGKSIYKRDIAAVLTNQYFTDQAKQEAAVLGVKLWDRDKLQELIIHS